MSSMTSRTSRTSCIKTLQPSTDQLVVTLHDQELFVRLVKVGKGRVRLHLEGPDHLRYEIVTRDQPVKCATVKTSRFPSRDLH